MSRLLRSCGALLAIGLAGPAAIAELPSHARARDPRVDELRTLVGEAESAVGAGRLDEAETLYRTVLERAEPERPNLLVARAVDGLGDLCRAQDRLEEAETLYLRAASIWEPLLGSRQPRLATTLHNLGLVYLERDDLDEAEPTLARALTIWEQTLGPDSEQARLTRRAAQEVALRRDESGPEDDR